MQASETWTLLAVEWDPSAPVDASAAAKLFAEAASVCKCPVPGVTLLAHRSATAAVAEALGVIAAYPAKAVLLTCEFESPEYIGFSPVSSRLYGLLKLLPPGVAICALSTHEAVRHAMGDRAVFLHIGSVGLPGIGGKERVFQICPAGSAEEPIVLDRGERAIDTLPGNYGYFVGRKVEMDQCFLHIENGRPVTLTGIVGIGKSHLACRVAREAKSNFSSGVAWVSLSGAQTQEQITAAMARGLAVQSATDIDAAVRRILTEEEVLVVIDGVDDSRDAICTLLDGPLRGATSTFIVTATKPVGYFGEQVVPLAPMTTPPQDASIEPEALYDFEASALFLDRVADLSPSLLDHMDADATAELMRRLEGHPQRICVAAAQMRFQSVNMILAGLPIEERRAGGRRAAGSVLAGLSQVCQDAAVALSLCETRISSFQLGRLDARFAADHAPLDMLMKSGLCEESVSPSGRLVYALYPSVRNQVRHTTSSARKKLEHSHEALFIELVWDAVKGHNMTALGGDLDLAEEHSKDFFVALASLGRHAPAGELVQVLGGTWPFIFDHNHVDECVSIIKAALARPTGVPGEPQVRLLNAAGILATKGGQHETARRCFEEGLELLGDAGDMITRAKIVSNLSWLTWADGNPEVARDQATFAVDLFRHFDEPCYLASALMTSVIAHVECGDRDAATSALQESLAVDPPSTPKHRWSAELSLGQVAWLAGDADEARLRVLNSVELARHMRDHLSMLRSLIWLAQVLVDAKADSASTRVLGVAAHNQTESAYRLHPANQNRVRGVQERLVGGMGRERYRAELITASAQSLDQVLASICQV